MGDQVILCVPLAIVRVKLELVAEPPAECVAVTVRDWSPPAVGVPVMAPVEEFNERPAGKLPEPIVKVRSLEAKPDVDTAEENASPTVPLVVPGLPTLAPSYTA